MSGNVRPGKTAAGGGSPGRRPFHSFPRGVYNQRISRRPPRAPMTRLPAVGLLVIVLAPAPARADGPPAEAVEFFEKKVRPVLAEHCYRCHSAGSKSLKGGLR